MLKFQTRPFNFLFKQYEYILRFIRGGIDIGVRGGIDIGVRGGIDMGVRGGIDIGVRCGIDMSVRGGQGCRAILKSLTIEALRCLENKGFVSQGLKKVLFFGAANSSVEMCVVVKRLTPINIY